ncbi:signal transduction histidine kinase with CheB and CheR activity [Anaeromyxobacter dehalogenans 2CP-1]|uniref:Signal transduction histidine kinase with CheB and CheR activity n=1 Tax=Anaeromyxobacter dehalogenans (strain ATCC BAA-258 / DSM 21875 / 2CP-1) TaxID=455488 RepID=B8JHJ8_ANAD2|nr:chemotaxis protein CheB [Anaeromyxobacter dehalogenans]ACL66710.1 signal transduction histidine kinase with CheB and CheR activity [Anaeromyxobacter dehalogenans 2CP-1]
MATPSPERTASDAQEAEWRAREGERLLVVGIGASAGGLEALERFLRQVPPDSGLAYVVVQHLSPEHESSLADILARATQLPVELASEGKRIERDHVYVIPPAAGLVVERGALRLVPFDHRGARLLVNAFLTSLAEDQRENAVGVVLSGTGSDGALGIAAVKRHGGRTFAQAAGDARYESMPAAAIATGMVEQVLPAEEIPAALVKLAAERRHHPPESARGEAEGLRQALETVGRTTGHDFSRYKRTTILRRLHRRMAATGLGSVREYAALLEGDADETRFLAEDLTINVTSFFRDDGPFQVLEQVVIPDLLKRRRAEGVRLWVPACSSGEEAYSLAILFCERGDELPRPPQIQVFATDIDASALAEARRGQYTSVVERQVSAERLARFFTRRGDSYSVTRPLRDLCIFTEHDLVRDPPFSRMDLVSCRNLLIYLEPALQKRVIELLHYALRPGGYLLLGKAEMIDAQELELFEVVDKTERVFRRREVDRRPAILPPGRRALPLELAAPSRRGDPEVRSAADRSRSIVLEEYAPPSVVVDARGEIRYYWGTKLAFFLPPRAGAPSTNLMHVARRELRVELSAALHNAARQAKPVTYKDVVVEAEGVQRRLNIVVRPLPPSERDPDELFLVVFEELQSVPIAHGTPLDAPTLERHRQLQRDLESTQERLQVTIEELENANEALRSSNEQLQAMNEEMHSANEELQTSQEELQSVNEELNTLNAELNKKVDELELLYGDIQNLFQSTQIATIFLDRQSRIARFTPAATAVFRLADGDVGRPLSDFAARFDAQGVPQEVATVLETLAPVERTVGLVDEKRSFLMRMNPYRTPSNVIAGVVVSFIDITQLKETEAALRRAVEERERAEQSLRDEDRRKDQFLAVLSHELRNPLAPILSSLHVLEHATADTGAAAKAHEIIARQVGYLARLVDDLLDATRIANGKLQVERRPLDLRELARRTAEDHRVSFTTREVALEVALPDEPVWVEGDATRLAQVIGNVLQNAAKFTPGGGSVRLSLEAADPVAVLRVRDTGVGVDPAMIPRLFQPFSQADTTLDRRLGGLGLGLALVKGLVETHGGTIALSSGGKGMGTEVIVRLPLMAAPARVEVAPAAAPPRPRRILVIEDNIDAAESLRLALEMEGHEVAVAHDGPHGIRRARELTPEVVLCDIGLPEMDGYAVARALRHEPGLRNTLLIALTGYALPDDHRRAVEAGFDAHLTKPTTVEGVQEAIDRAPPPASPGGGAPP